MKRILFIGNSATYVHEIPKALVLLAGKRGIELEVAQITPGGFELRGHADPKTSHGQRVPEELKRGYHTVFLQDNGNCVATEENKRDCALACQRLISAIRESGAEPRFYVRPPYGQSKWGLTPLQQCKAFDELFCGISRDNGGVACAFANRAFARAIERTSLPLWGEDQAHTSPHGAYLVVCCLFTSLFGRSARELDPWLLSPEDALVLQDIANEVSLSSEDTASFFKPSR